MSPKEKLLQAAKELDLAQIELLILEGNVALESPLQSLLDDRIKSEDYSAVGLLLRSEESLIHLEKTGEIKDDLLPFFDQNGQWYGLGLSPSAKDLHCLVYKALKVPKERLEKVDPEGIHLLCSYNDDRVNPLKLPYVSIGGSLDAYDTKKIDLPNLKRVGSDILSWHALNFNAPQLEFVGGNLELGGALEINTPELKEVGGYFCAHSCQKLHVPHLRSCAGDFLADKANEFFAPELARVGGLLAASLASKIVVSNLKTAGRGLRMPNLNPLRNWQLKHIQKSVCDWKTRTEIREELKKREIIESIQGETMELNP